VKKNGVEALHSERDALKKEKAFTFYAAEELMRRPRAVRKSMAEQLIMPEVSTAIGWK